MYSGETMTRPWIPSRAVSYTHLDVYKRQHLTLREVELNHIRNVLREEGGHVERAAKRLNIPRSTLYQKIKAYGLG